MDYLKKLKHARSIEKMVLYIRAHGCYVAAYAPKVPEAAQRICDAEHDAHIVEVFGRGDDPKENIKLAREFLKKRGYFGKV